MKKNKLEKAVTQAKTETGAALQMLFDNINQGQQKQLVKLPEIKELFDRFGVKYDG